MRDYREHRKIAFQQKLLKLNIPLNISENHIALAKGTKKGSRTCWRKVDVLTNKRNKGLRAWPEYIFW